MTTRAEFLAMVAARGRSRGDVFLHPGFDEHRDPEDCWVITAPGAMGGAWTTHKPGRSGERALEHPDESAAYNYVLARLPALLPEQRHVSRIPWRREWFLEELRNRDWSGPRFVFAPDPDDDEVPSRTVVIHHQDDGAWNVYENGLGPDDGRLFESETEALTFVVAHYLGWA